MDHGAGWIRRGRLGRPLGFTRNPGRKDLGAWGEWVALRHLRRLGWDVVARNWRGRRGEVDLFAFEGPFLVCVEVKTRRIPSALPPEDNIDDRKIRTLEALCLEFLLRHELEQRPYRFDLVALETPDFRSFALRHYVGL